MTLRNKVQLIGHVGQTPEFRTTEGGNKLAKFSLATNETYKNEAGARVTTTTWHSVLAWNNLAQIAAEYLNKGSEVVIEGKIINRSYEKDGVKRYVSEIQANELLLLGSKPKEQNLVEVENDLPFDKEEQVVAE